METADNPVVGLKYSRVRDYEDIEEKYWVMRKWDPGWMECQVDEFMASMFDDPISYKIGNWEWRPKRKIRKT